MAVRAQASTKRSLGAWCLRNPDKVVPGNPLS
ncbi:hypothetical protein CNECB9_4820011 [Cupriavidus necator]|uniref:Uncharacterized protein n=1 Tax=Cupriavidus necator TaxID=106590 RepID=A0A1K0IM72_CUPNE|nr:hypothetical protein CNECB9_4820011 [Cupriavidus necator]